MTTKEKIEVLQAYDEGKQIESRNLDIPTEWKLCKEIPSWDFSTMEYRIKRDVTVPVDSEIQETIDSLATKLNANEINIFADAYRHGHQKGYNLAVDAAVNEFQNFLNVRVDNPEYQLRKSDFASWIEDFRFCVLNPIH